jgi:2-polyprenyl-3-methyl-5-hydroxy-6-metoxy-1,4-benzoquinol methylase
MGPVGTGSLASPSPLDGTGLVPDEVHALWQRTARREITAQEYESGRLALLSRYAEVWRDALLLEGHFDLTTSLLEELASYVGRPESEVRRRCEEAVSTLRDQWNEGVRADRRGSVESFYDQSEVYLYDLMWWHTLTDDDSALGYVLALDFARRRGCRKYLDFGCGVGSGGILFERNGFEVTNADISSVLLAFSASRLRSRGLRANLIDMKDDELPTDSFDFVTAMDTFEHLVDPIDAIEKLWESLRDGGFLFGRFNNRDDDDHPQHIVRDFGPVQERMKSLGLVEVWRDDWVWGHQAFQKSA